MQTQGNRVCNVWLPRRRVVFAVLIPLLAGGQSPGRALPAQSPASAVPQPHAFEVASVRLMVDRDKLPLEQQLVYMSPPGAAQFTVRNVTLSNLIAFAYKLPEESDIAGKPGWMNSAFYEIAAKPEGDAGLSYDQLRPLLIQLLKDRFHLAYHNQTKTVKGYALVLAKGGSKLTPSKGEAAHAYLLVGRLDGVNEPASMLAGMLGIALHEKVVDETGLKGNYDFKLSYAPMDATDSTQPSIFTAVEEQLGLKLETRRVPVKMFVIDHVDEVPTEN